MELRRILHVDDDEDVLMIARRALERGGRYEVRSMSSAAAALLELATFRPQLVLADLVMPVMDGRSFLFELQRTPAAAMTALVFVTSSFTAVMRDELMAQGAAEAIWKPFDPTDWQECVAEVWRRIQAIRARP